MAVATELKIGCRIEYLAYKHQETDHIKVVKIDQVIDQYWDEETPTEQKVSNVMFSYYVLNNSIFSFRLMQKLRS